MKNKYVIIFLFIISLACSHQNQNKIIENSIKKDSEFLQVNNGIIGAAEQATDEKLSLKLQDIDDQSAPDPH